MAVVVAVVVVFVVFVVEFAVENVFISSVFCFGNKAYADF